MATQYIKTSTSNRPIYETSAMDIDSKIDEIKTYTCSKSKELKEDIEGIKNQITEVNNTLESNEEDINDLNESIEIININFEDFKSERYAYVDRVDKRIDDLKDYTDQRIYDLKEDLKDLKKKIENYTILYIGTTVLVILELIMLFWR